jgi:hypothetical protein
LFSELQNPFSGTGSNSLNDSITKSDALSRSQAGPSGISPPKRMGPSSKVFFKVPQLGTTNEDNVSDMQEEEDYLQQETRKREQRKRESDKETDRIRSVSKSLKRIELDGKKSKDKT